MGISAGFALSVSPVTAWAISTPSEGLVTDTIQVPLGSEQMPAYWAMPKGKGPFPVVLVIQEIFGIHAYIQDVCRRLAKEGNYLAIAPSLYFRQGDATKIEDRQKLVSEIVSKVPQSGVMTDLDATLKFLKTKKVANTARVGITGYCWGGNVTWMYSAHNPSLKAGVAWYGRLKGDVTPVMQKYPVEIAKDLKVPVLGLYGAEDQGIPVESVEQMRQALATGKSGSEIIVYPEAEHGFHADYRPSYHEASAKEAWGKLLAWFKKHGVSAFPERSA